MCQISATYQILVSWMGEGVFWGIFILRGQNPNKKFCRGKFEIAYFTGKKVLLTLKLNSFFFFHFSLKFFQEFWFAKETTRESLKKHNEEVCLSYLVCHSLSENCFKHSNFMIYSGKLFIAFFIYIILKGPANYSLKGSNDKIYQK